MSHQVTDFSHSTFLKHFKSKPSLNRNPWRNSEKKFLPGILVRPSYSNYPDMPLKQLCSQTSANGQQSTAATFSPRRTKKPHIDSCLKPLVNRHLFTSATFFCSQGGRWREFQLYRTDEMATNNTRMGWTATATDKDKCKYKSKIPSPANITS